MDKKYHPCDPYSRFLDLQKQGFMKSAKRTPKKPKAPAPSVACDFCLDWHPKNKHTATKEQRDTNVAERKARDPHYKPQQRIIG